MRRLLAPVVAVLLTVGLLTTAPLAEAAPPTSTWAGSGGGDTARVDLNVAGGLQLAGARLAVSQADSGSTRTPNRSTARSANLGATVANLPISVLSNQEVAGPTAGDVSSSPGLSATSAVGVAVGALQTSDRAVWNGDNACVLGGTPLARASTQTAGVSLAPLGLALLTTGTSTTTGTTQLTPTGNGGYRNGVQTTATGAVENVSVLGAQIGVAGDSTLRTTATGSTGGASFAYNPGTVTFTPPGGSTRTIAVGGTDTATINLAGGLQRASVTVDVNNPTTNLAANGTSATASVAVVTVTVRVFVIATNLTLLTSTIDLVPLRSSATAPAGGIDCPAPQPAAPVVTTPADGSRTNDTTPTYSGTGVAGASVNLTVDGTRQADVATVAGDGTWTFTPTADLSAGSHTVSATQTLFGTESNASGTNTFVVDLTAPAAPVLTQPANGTVTNDRTPTYTGTAEPLSTVTVREGSTVVGTGQANASGSFSITSSQLDPGPHSVSARATDQAGNVSTVSNTLSFTIDTTAPAAPVITTPAAGSTTTDTTPTISGTAEANASVRVFVDDVSVGTTTANGAGAWTLDSTTLGQGEHTATAVATDAAGNTSVRSAGVAFTVDSVAPDAPVITQPAAGSSTNDTTPDLRGTSEANASVQVFVDGASVGTTTANGSEAFTATPTTPLAEGPHTVTAVATDAVGNVSPTSTPVSFLVDTTAPASPVLTAPANGSLGNDATPTYTGTAEALSTVTVLEGTTVVGTGQADASGNFSITSSSLPDGPHTVVARATDAAGNDSALSNTTTFTIDTAAPPAPVVLVPADGSTTADTTPTLSGTAEAGSTVDVRVDGSSVGTVPADGNGAWSIDAPELGQGPHTVRAVATDAAGNASVASAQVGFVVDSVAPAAPVVTTPADGSTTSDTTPAISGTAAANSSVEVFVDGASVGTTTADGDGAFSVTPTTPLADGPRVATAVATDAGGNASPASAPVTFTVDTTAPAAPVVTAPADGSATSDTTPTLRGTAEANASVEVFVDAASVGTTTADGNGAWSIDAPVLAEGPHTVRAVATDAVGNVSLPSAPVTFRVDTSGPDAPVVDEPADGSSTTDTTPTVSGTAEADASVEVFVDGASVGTVTAVDGVFTLPLTTPLGEGPHTVTAVATDAAGIVSAPSEPVTFTVDTVAPLAPVITVPADGASVADTTPAISGTAEPGVDVEVFLDGTTIGTTTADGTGAFSVTPTTPLVEGQSYVATAVATDAAGNVSPASDPVTFTVDTVAPAAPVITTPAGGSTLTDTTPTISGTAEANASVEVLVDGDSVGTTTADGTGAWTLDSTVLAQGPHTATAVATDAAGNDSVPSAAVAFSIDSLAPAAPVVTAPADGSTVNDRTPDITGTAEADSTVEVSVDGTSVGTAPTDGDGDFTLPLTTPLDDGPHTVTAVATDAAGNVSQPSATVTFTVDATAPAVPVVTVPADGSTVTDTTPTISGTAEPNSSVEVFVDGQSVGTTPADGTGAWSLVSTVLDEGPHTVRAVATDAAGNASLPSEAVLFSIDATAPGAPVITVPADGSSTNDTTPTISGTAEANSSVEVFVDGDSVGTTPADVNGAWTLDSTLLAEGPHTATAVATDAAGNASVPSAEVDFTVDTVLPAAPVVTSPADGSTTNDTTPAISGTAEANSSVEVFVDGASVGTTTADGDGAFTVTPTTPLADGPRVATAVATDAGGNASPASAPVTFTVDATAPAAPVVTVPVDGSSTNDATPTISGTAEANASVEVFVDGTSVGTTTADGNGAWSLVSSALDEGPHTVRAVATDAAGNDSVPSDPVAFTVDVSVPDAPVVTAPADGTTVADPTPTITGTAEADSSVEVLVDGTSVAVVPADGDGNFSFTPAAPLADGPHTVTAIATDAAGNASAASEAVTFTVDTAAPTAPVITVPADGSSTTDTTPTISGTAEANSSVQVFVDGTSVGTTTADGDGAWSLDSTLLAEGPHSATARSTDAAGNVSVESAAVTFTVDTTAPVAPVITVPADGSSTADTTPTISGTAEANASIEVLVDGDSVGTTTADGTGAWSLDATTLAEGPHTATAVATDAAGNDSDPSAEVSFTVDLTAPAAPVVTSPADGSTTDDTTPTLSGTAEANASVEVFVDGDSVGTVPATSGGAWSIGSPVLAEGQHTVTAVATDAAGNVSPESAPVSFTVDVTAPEAPTVTVPANGSALADTTPTISGTAEPNASVEVFVDGVSVGTAPADGTGAWSLESTPLTEGPHTVTAVATDAAGNASGPSAPVTFAVDTGVPAAPVVTTPTDGSTITDTTPTISGTAEPNSSVEVFVDGASVGTVPADGTGAWSIDSPLLGEGPHTVTAIATDAAGNASDPSAEVAFTVDSAVPAAPVVTAPADGATVSDPTPAITGTAEPNASVEVFVDGTSIGTTPADGDGAWSLEAPLLGDGPHTVTATATDAAGNVSPESAPVTFTVDATAPAAPVVTVPVDGSSTNDATPTISGTAEANASVEVFVDGTSVGTTTADGNGAWSLVSSALDEGPHTVRAVATDAAGNDSVPSDPVAFTVDVTAPAAPVVTAPADGTTTPDPTPDVTGTAEPNSSVEVFVDGTSVGTTTADGDGAWTLTSPTLADGSHTVTAVATDAAGNVSPTSEPVTFTVDSTGVEAPVITVPVAGSSTNDTTPTISGTAEPNITVEVFVDGTSVGTTTSDGNGAWSLDSTVLAAGERTATAVGSDVAGNVSVPSEPVTFVVDVTAPAAPVVTAPLDGSAVADPTPTVTGTAEPNASVEVFVDGVSVGTTDADGDGNWSLTPTTPLTDGPHTVTAVATDAAGNDSPASEPVTFLVDATAPAAPVVTVPAEGSTVADTTPTISGTTEPNLSVEVFVDGNSVGTTVAGSTGAWSLDSTTLAEGPHTVTAVATDEAGNVSPDSEPVDFVVDVTAPAAPQVVTPADGSSTDDPTPTISGTAEPNSSVEVFVDGASVGTVPADGTGAWSIDSPLLGDGPHTVTATATDAAGNASDPSADVTFTVDTASPAAPVVTSPANGSTVTDPTPTITGTAEPNSSVDVLVDGVSVGTTQADGDGNWSFTPTTALGDGPHTVTATATDAAGNESPASEPVTFTVDATAPAAPVITVPADGSSTTDTTPTISGAAEANASVQVLVDGDSVGTTTADGNGAWSLDSTALDEGPHTATAVATDAAGNDSATSGPVDFTVDLTAPDAPVVLVPADGSTTNDPTPTVSGTAEPNASVEVFVDGDSVGTTTADGTGAWSLTPTTALGDGPHTVTATATDAAGNVSGPSAGVTFTVDALAPAPPVITVPADGSTTDDATPTISGTAEANASVEVFVDGTSVGTTTADGNGAWSLASTALADGPHTATAVATDAAGNDSAASEPVDFTVEAVAPAAPVITVPVDGSSTNDETPTISGTAQPNASIEVFVDGLLVGTTVADGNGAWSLESSVLADGPHTATAVATDGSGASPQSAPVDFTVDGTAPEPPVVTTPADGSSTADTTPVLRGTAEAGSTVEVFVDGESVGTTTADDAGAWSLDSPELEPGDHEVYATSTDAAGNVSEPSATNTFTVTADDGGNGGGDGNGNGTGSGTGNSGNGTGSGTGNANGTGGGSLAATGGPSLAIALVGLLLLVSGGVTLLVSRRRRG